jgi:hypothetical protein
MAADIADVAQRMRDLKPEADARFEARLASKRPLWPKEVALVLNKTETNVREMARAGRFEVTWLSPRTFLAPYPGVWRAATGLQRYHGLMHPDDEVIELPSRPYERPSGPRDFGGCVYYIRAVTTGFIKIGIAIDFRNRFRGLCSASPDKLVVLAVVEGQYRDEEQALHKKFAKERSHGEWFHPSKRLMKHIRAIQLQTDSPVVRSQWEVAE